VLKEIWKVLLVAKALLNQAHPNKKLAKKLHSNYPKIYKDGNHKQVMALALIHFVSLEVEEQACL